MRDSMRPTVRDRGLSVFHRVIDRGTVAICHLDVAGHLRPPIGLALCMRARYQPDRDAPDQPEMVRSDLSLGIEDRVVEREAVAGI
jgi:hypothetical protein